MQQQHLAQMQPMMAAYYSTNVTTDHIQQYLDENKSLILKIVESQNSGKLSECAENQARLQRNLMYLAAIADSQPQPPNIHTQYSGGAMLQPSGHYLQQQQAQQMSTPPQSLLMGARSSSMLYGTAQPYASLQQQQAAAMHGMSSAGGSSSGTGGQMLQGEPHGGSFPDFVRKHDIGISNMELGRSGGNDGTGETLYLKTAEDDGNN